MNFFTNIVFFVSFANISELKLFQWIMTDFDLVRLGAKLKAYLFWRILLNFPF